jgi:hypothetical protein
MILGIRVKQCGWLCTSFLVFLALTACSTTKTPSPKNQPLTPAGCSPSMQYLADVTIPNGTQVKPGEHFTKTWKVKNDGSCDWDGYLLALGRGEAMGGAETEIPLTNPGKEVDLSIDLTAPTNPGNYSANWELRTSLGDPLGELILDVQVVK